MSLETFLFWALTAAGTVYGVLEHTGTFNTPMSKHRSDLLRNRLGSMTTRAGMVLLYSFGTAAFVATASAGAGSLDILPGVLFVSHFLKRIAESLFVHVYSSPMDKGTVAYLSSCYVFIGWLFAYDSMLPPLAAPSQRSLGVALWLGGEACNAVHHWILRSLRLARKDVAYVVPEGGLFTWILFPHYLGEMVTWLGLSLVLHRSAAYGCMLFMLQLQVGRSSAQKQWYAKKFPGLDRPGLVPGVF